MPNEKYSYTSSRLIKEVVAGGGDISKFLPPEVEAKLREKLKLPRGTFSSGDVTN